MSAECTSTAKPRWVIQECFDCSGLGQVSSYTYGGMDFNGPEECRTCNGSGTIYRSPKGSLAQWPGGPFIGRERKST